MRHKRILRSLICLILITCTLSITAFAYIPVEVYMRTDKTTYSKNEVVRFTICIDGGFGSNGVPPVYTYRFTDSNGYYYRSSTTDSTITLNKAYSEYGSHTATVSVTSNQSSNTAVYTVYFTVAQP